MLEAWRFHGTDNRHLVDSSRRSWSCLTAASSELACPDMSVGLLAPLERKRAQPIAEHVRIPYQRLHHFLNVSAWDTGAFQLLLRRQERGAMAGGNRKGRPDAVCKVSCECQL